MAIRNVLEYFDLDEIDLIFIENIGNLVCPAEFNIGEDLKIAILSIPEGDDKVEKYPLLFSIADITLLSKYDMMQYFDFDDEKIEKNIKSLNLTSDLLRISARTGEGINSLVNYIEDKVKGKG